jgi:phage terminase large subunit GpA-like protein
MFADARQLKMDCRPFVMPPQRVNVQYAAENYMMLKGGGGLTRWKASKTPYLIEPMNCLVSRLYRAVGFMGPARSGKTEALLKATVAHAVKCDPSDVLIVHMNQNESEYFSKTEIETMLKASKELKERLSPISRDNNVGFIRLKAGNVIKLAWPTDEIRFTD